LPMPCTFFVTVGRFFLYPLRGAVSDKNSSNDRERN
jgi:hypothetical protein